MAIKVLPDEFAENEERLARFKREAKVLASLNHPNIASIYGLEQSESTHYLVLELVPGETLAERISRGPIPVEEALDIATKIAEALEEAHEQGIVHRDLKPANVKQTEDGKIKVLDYGLAKVFQEETAEADSSMSPTLTRDATRVGVILGTAAYMSPEQAKGKKVDKRADIWAFGVVLYEMLTGKRAFAGEDVSDTLAYVLTKEPDWTVLPGKTPTFVRQVLRLCLTKDAKQRARDIGDVRLAMKDAFESGGTAEQTTPHPSAWQPSVGVAAAAALTLSIVSGLAVWSLSTDNPSSPLVTRSSIPLPPDVALTGAFRVLALSPDGSHLVYSANSRLYLRALNQSEAMPIRGTEGGARDPFFSPDGEWIGRLHSFRGTRDGHLARVRRRWHARSSHPSRGCGGSRSRAAGLAGRQSGAIYTGRWIELEHSTDRRAFARDRRAEGPDRRRGKVPAIYPQGEHTREDYRKAPRIDAGSENRHCCSRKRLLHSERA